MLCAVLHCTALTFPAAWADEPIGPFAGGLAATPHGQQGDVVLPSWRPTAAAGECLYPEPFWVPLSHWKHRLFRHSDPNDPLRHMGIGGPLHGTSWRNRPLHAGWLVGGIWGDRLTDAVDQSEELFGGYRFGYDFDHYWGSEIRLAWGNVDLSGAEPAGSHTAGHFYYDAHLLYYPWGDAHWRPYASLGLGGARFRFDDEQGVHHEEHLVHLPLQIGVKYLFRKWLALRVEASDNFAFGGDRLDSMHNFSLTGGVEVHFGGWRRSYYPWSPSTSLW